MLLFLLKFGPREFTILSSFELAICNTEYSTPVPKHNWFKKKFSKRNWIKFLFGDKKPYGKSKFQNVLPRASRGQTFSSNPSIEKWLDFGLVAVQLKSYLKKPWAKHFEISIFHKVFNPQKEILSNFSWKFFFEPVTLLDRCELSQKAITHFYLKFLRTFV